MPGGRQPPDDARLPYPLALTARRISDSLADSPSQPLNSLQRVRECFEATIRYFGLVLLAESWPRLHPTPDQAEPLLQLLMRPLTSQWIELLASLSVLRVAGGPGPGHDLASAFALPRRRKAQATPLLDRCREFVPFRNELAHGAPSARSAEHLQARLHDWLPLIEQLLEVAAGLDGWPLIRVLGTESERYESWMGLGSPGPPQPGSFAAAQVGHYLLMGPRGEAPVDLDPLLFYGTLDSGQARLHFYDSIYRWTGKRKEVRMLEYDSGEWYPRGEPADGLRRLFGDAPLDAAFKQFRGKMVLIENRIVASFGELIDEHADIVGREFVIEEVRQFLDEQPSGLIVLEAEPGMGKTALMAHLTQEVFGGWDPPPVHFFFRRTAGITSPAVCIRTLYYNLLAYYGPEEDPESRAKDSPAEVYIKFTNLINEQVARRLLPGKSQVMLIDALDESREPAGGDDAGGQSDSPVEFSGIGAFDRIVHQLPRGVFVIVSTRPVPEKALLARRPNLKWIDLDDPKYARKHFEDGLRYVQSRLGEMGLGAELYGALSRFAAGNFLVLELVCRHIQANLTAGDVPAFLERLATAGGAAQDQLGAIYGEFWLRLTSACTPEQREAVAAVAGILAAAQGPLSRGLMMGVLGASGERWSHALRHLGEYLTVRTEHERGVQATFYRIYHKSFADFLNAHVVADPAAVHRRFADFCCGWEQMPEGYPRTYALRNGPTHLAQAGDRDRLHRLLTDVRFLDAKVSAALVFDLIADLGGAAALFPAGSAEHRRLALLDEALQSHVHFLVRHPPTLYQCLYNVGWWYDSRDAAAHYHSGDVGPWRDPLLSPLLEQAGAPPGSWLRALRPPAVHLDGPQRAAFLGHVDGIETVAVSWDGRFVASAGGNADKDTAVRLWDLDNGQLLKTFRGHERLVHRVRFSRDGKLLVTASADRTVRVWSVAEARELYRLEDHEGNVDCVSIAPRADRIVTGSRDGRVLLWPIDPPPPGPAEPLSRGVSQARGIAINPSGTHAAAAFLDGVVRIWDLASRRLVRELRGHTDGIYSLAFSPDSRRLASGSRDRTVRIWDWQADPPAEVAVLEGHGHWVYSVTFSPDGRWLASGSRDQTVRVWDVNLNEEVLNLRGHHGAVYSVAFRPPAGEELVSGAGDGVIRVWGLRAPAQRALEDHTAPIRCLAFTPDGARVVTGSGHVYLDDNTVRVWDVASGRPALPPLRGHADNVLCVAVSEGARRIASGARDRTLRLWDGTTGREQWCLPHPLPVEGVALTRDGRLVASGCLDHRVRVWELEPQGPTLRHEFAAHTLLVAALAASPDGRRLATGGVDGQVWLWDLTRGSGERLGAGLGPVCALAFSPDGGRLVAQLAGEEDLKAPSGDACLWDLQAGRRMTRAARCWDLHAVAARAEFRATLDPLEGETVIRSRIGDAAAWFPEILSSLASCPSRRTWAGAAGNHLFLLELRIRTG